MIRPHRLHHVLALAFAAAVVSACDISGVGDGSKPEKLEIVRNPNTDLIDLGGDVEQYFLCFPEQLQAVVTFSNGGIDSSGLLNQRVLWSTSDPAVVEVSNAAATGGEVVLIPGSETQAFSPGILVPRGVGTAKITAEFIGLSASYDVEVREVDSVQINKTEVKVAPETGDLLTLTAVIDGYTLDVTQSPLWQFDTDDEDVDDIATIGQSTGVITGVGLGGPLTAKADFPLCREDSKFADLTATVVVEELTGLQIAREFADAPNDELIVGTTEKLTVTGSFADGTALDLSGQVRVESSEVEVVAPGTVFPQFLTALEAGTAQLQAIYGGDDENDEEGDTDPPEVRSNTITLNTVDGELQDFDITPLNPTITTLGVQQFVATGTFSVAGETRTQPITRGVVWAESTLEDEVTTLVDISNSSLSAGRAVSRSIDAGAFKITATRTLPSDDEEEEDDDNELVRETVLCVVKPNTPGAPCPPPDEDDETAP